MDHFHEAGRSDERLIHFAVEASDPFEFPAKYILYDRITERERIRGLNKVPVTLDASASAYQIMSSLLLNTELAMQTNLIPSPVEAGIWMKIQDLYMCLKDELLEFLYSQFGTNKYGIIQSRLTRKLIKRLFIPLIYGKTIMTMGSDIREDYG